MLYQISLVIRWVRTHLRRSLLTFVTLVFSRRTFVDGVRFFDVHQFVVIRRRRFRQPWKVEFLRLAPWNRKLILGGQCGTRRSIHVTHHPVDMSRVIPQWMDRVWRIERGRNKTAQSVEDSSGKKLHFNRIQNKFEINLIPNYRFWFENPTQDALHFLISWNFKQINHSTVNNNLFDFNSERSLLEWSLNWSCDDLSIRRSYPEDKEPGRNYFFEVVTAQSRPTNHEASNFKPPLLNHPLSSVWSGAALRN